MTRATFTADRTPTDDINAAVDERGRFILATGGDVKNVTKLLKPTGCNPWACDALLAVEK